MSGWMINWYEAVYRGCAELAGGYGGGLVALSLLTALLLAPLRKLAGGVAERHRKLLDAMRPSLETINRESKGAQRHERLQRLHRRYGYSPLQALAGAAELFVQVPVLLLAYYMLANCEAIRGVAAGPVPDLGKPDGLLGGLNLLPIIMTAVNLAALCATPGWTRRERTRGLGLAALFLVLLYAMPSALLVFWTVNNLISLAGNLLDRAGGALAARFGGPGGPAKAAEWAWVPSRPVLSAASLALLVWRWSAIGGGEGDSAAAFTPLPAFWAPAVLLCAAALYVTRPRWRRAIAATGLADMSERFGLRVGGGGMYAGALLAVSALVVLYCPAAIYRSSPEEIGMGFAAFFRPMSRWFLAFALIGGYLWLACAKVSRPPLAAAMAFLSLALLLYGLVFNNDQLTLMGIRLENVPEGGRFIPLWVDFAVPALSAAVLVLALVFDRARWLRTGFFALAAGFSLFCLDTFRVQPSPAPAAAVVVDAGGDAATVVAKSPLAKSPPARGRTQTFFPADSISFARGEHEKPDARSLLFLPGKKRRLVGPYKPVEAGDYTLEVAYEYLDGNDDGPLVTFDMFNVRGRKTYAKQDLPRDRTVVGIPVSVGSFVQGMEFRVYLPDGVGAFRVDYFRLSAAREARAATATNAPTAIPTHYTFSNREVNHLYIILDMFDGREVERILADRPGLRRRFEGFTWYPNTLAPGFSTHLSLTAMMGGRDHTAEAITLRRDEPRWSKMFKAFTVLPGEFLRRGRRVAMPDPPNIIPGWFRPPGKPVPSLADFLPEYDPSSGRLHLVANLPKSFLAEWEREIGMTAMIDSGAFSFYLSLSVFRVAPGWLKGGVYGNGAWLGSAGKMDRVFTTKVLEDCMELGTLTRKSAVDGGPGLFALVYSKMTHWPYYLGPDGLIPEDRPQPHHYTERRALAMLADFFDWMKENGVYDNTHIMVVSDHSGSGASELPGHESIGDFFRSNGHNPPEDLLELAEHPNRMHALFMRKDVGGRHPMAVDATPVSGAEMPYFFLSVLEDDPGRLSFLKDPSRPRQHAVFGHAPINGQPDTIGFAGKTAIITGDHTDPANWKLEERRTE